MRRVHFTMKVESVTKVSILYTIVQVYCCWFPNVQLWRFDTIINKGIISFTRWKGDHHTLYFKQMEWNEDHAHHNGYISNYLYNKIANYTSYNKQYVTSYTKTWLTMQKSCRGNYPLSTVLIPAPTETDSSICDLIHIAYTHYKL